MDNASHGTTTATAPCHSFRRTQAAFKSGEQEWCTHFGSAFLCCAPPSCLHVASQRKACPDEDNVPERLIPVFVYNLPGLAMIFRAPKDSQLLIALIPQLPEQTT